MFVYDNGNVNVLSMKKCGHSAMVYYFNRNKKYTDPGDPHEYIHNGFPGWISFASPKAVVVRNPIQRMRASINWYIEVFEKRVIEYEATGKVDDFNLIKDLINYKDREWRVEEFIFNQHCRPYLQIIKSRDFRIIRFENLSEYIPKETLHDTKTRACNIDPFPVNRYFNRDDMLQELEVYENIVATREVITPEEWKAIT